jgi:hypothetical protein
MKALMMCEVIQILAEQHSKYFLTESVTYVGESTVTYVADWTNVA